MIETLLQDLRYALRTFGQNPGATALSVFALAMGIGVNTAVFTAYKAMVLRPVDAVEPERMQNVAVVRDSGAAEVNFSYPDYLSFRDSVRGFSGVVAFRPSRVTIADRSGRLPPVSTRGLLSPGTQNFEYAYIFVASPNYFDVIGGTPLLRGEAFASANSVVIGQTYWESRFAGDPTILGRTLHLNGVPVTVTGIARRGFTGTGISEPTFWLSTGIDPVIESNPELLTARGNPRYRIFGRLAPGATASQARGELDASIERVRALHKPESAQSKHGTALVWQASPFPLPLDRYPGLKTTVLLIMLAAGMVLAVACANVGSLQLARARSRQFEFRTRAWLGATRGRMIRQLATEYALLGLVAGAFGHTLSFAMLKGLVYAGGRILPIEYGSLIFEVAPDLEIWCYIAGISVLGGLLAGIAPLWIAKPGSAAGADGRRLQDVLVAGQVALSLVLLTAAAMLTRSSLDALHAEPGYAAANLIQVDVQFRATALLTPVQQRALLSDLRSRIAALPGVQEVTRGPAPGALPFVSAGAHETVHYGSVESNYFSTLGIPLVAGQVPEDEGNGAAILNETAAQRLWPGEREVLGRMFRLSGNSYTVAGIVRNTANLHIGRASAAEAYMRSASGPAAGLQTFLIRTGGPATQAVRTVESLMRNSADPSMLTTVYTLEDSIRRSSAVVISGLAAAVASTVGLLGLVLALMGIAGTVSYIVVLRTREVGIRMAIGAQKRDVLSLILRESGRPVMAGLLFGVPVASMVLYGLRRFIYGAGSVDFVSLATVSALFLSAALMAGMPPARRAASVDPSIALRHG